MLKSILTVTCVALLSCPVFAGGSTAGSSAAPDPYAGNLVRISKIKVDPAQVDVYKTYAAEVGRESMKRGPGVRVLYSIQEKKDPTQFYILEIYADQEAYRQHIQSRHFQQYKQGTLKMVKELELIDCNALVPEALIKP